MRSVINNYAVEGRGDDGKPNGKFWITRSDMNTLAEEILSNNMGFGDASKRANYADARVPKIWAHFDMFNKGYLAVEVVPQFLRMLLGEVEVANSLQLQLGEQTGAMVISEKQLERPIDKVVLQFRPNPAQAPWAAKAEDEPKSAIHNAFTPEAHGHEDYERQVPHLWDSTDRDDLLVRSVIMNYALEGRGAGGAPTGKFYLDLP